MKKEICWINSLPDNKIRIGYMGGPLYEVDYFKLHNDIWEHKVENTPEAILKYAIKQSQYVEFEEIELTNYSRNDKADT
jgi:hypothetical protein